MEPTPHPLDAPEAWERAALDAVAIAPPPIEQLALAYRRLSAHHHAHPNATGRIQPLVPDDAATQLIRLLVFARRTYVIVRYLAPLLPQAGALTEHGAGYAPALLALAQDDRQTAAIELFPGYEDVRAQLFAAAGLPAPTPRPPSSTSEPPADGDPALQIYPFSLSEIARRDPHAGGALIARHLEVGDAVLVLEAGDRHHARCLQAVRDHLAEHRHFPRHPCRPQGPCPKSADPKDWCHFTLLHAPGDLERRLLTKADRDPDRVHFSFVLYGPSDPAPAPALPPAPELLTVLRPVERGKNRHVVETCGPRGLERWVALKRHRALFEATRDLPPVTVIGRPSRAEPKGDGYRLDPEEPLEPLPSLTPHRP